MRVVPVSLRLGHLPPVCCEQPGVHPVPYEGLETGERLGLGDLGLVVGVDQLTRATVYVVLWTEVSHADSSILDVPARGSGSPRALPPLLRTRRRPPE